MTYKKNNIYSFVLENHIPEHELEGELSSIFAILCLGCCSNVMFHLTSLTSLPALLPSYVLIKAGCNFFSCCLYPLSLIEPAGISPDINPSFLG